MMVRAFFVCAFLFGFVACTGSSSLEGFPCTEDSQCRDLSCLCNRCTPISTPTKYCEPIDEPVKEDNREKVAEATLEVSRETQPDEKPVAAETQDASFPEEKNPPEPVKEPVTPDEFVSVEKPVTPEEPKIEEQPEQPVVAEEPTVDKTVVPEEPKVERQPEEPTVEKPSIPEEPTPPEPQCVQNETRPCYSGPANTRGKGECKDGTQTCSNWNS